jgi:hypothetical protein
MQVKNFYVEYYIKTTLEFHIISCKILVAKDKIVKEFLVAMRVFAW